MVITAMRIGLVTTRENMRPDLRSIHLHDSVYCYLEIQFESDRRAREMTQQALSLAVNDQHSNNLPPGTMTAERQSGLRRAVPAREPACSIDRSEINTVRLQEDMSS